MVRENFLMVRMSTEEMDHLDAVRGARTRSDYVRGFIAEAQSHRREAVVRSEWVKGREVDIWACGCGEELG